MASIIYERIILSYFKIRLRFCLTIRVSPLITVSKIYNYFIDIVGIGYNSRIYLNYGK